jgi:hypothetical protein
LTSCTIVFRNYLKNGTFYEKHLLKTKCVSWFSLQRLSETFFIIIKNERDMIKHPRGVCVIVKMYNSVSILSQKRHVLRKKFIEIKLCVMIYSSNVFRIVFHYNKKWARYDQTSSQSVRVIVKLYKSFSTYSQKWHLLRKMLLKIKCVFWFSLHLLSETFFIIIRNDRDMIKHPRLG